MKINKVTITGLDKPNDIWNAMQLEKKFPFVEWGILFSTNSEGKPRYPFMNTIDQIIKSGINLSAHFCGVWAKTILEQQNFRVIETLNPAFKRVQLNYNFMYNDRWSIEKLMDFALQYNEREVILQYNKSNSRFIEIYREHFPGNLHLLYDASGGRGSKIASIQPPFNTYTGYAGGIDIDNINEVCQLITDSPHDDKVWIDLESGARTNDVFDIQKVESILETASKFI